MADERRQHQRLPLSIDIKISHPQIGERIVKTRDFSEGGIFVIITPSDLPPIGELVQGQVQGMAADAPVVPMRIVRAEKDGVGLRYEDT